MCQNNRWRRHYIYYNHQKSHRERTLQKCCTTNEGHYRCDKIKTTGEEGTRSYLNTLNKPRGEDITSVSKLNVPPEGETIDVSKITTGEEGTYNLFNTVNVTRWGHYKLVKKLTTNREGHYCNRCFENFNSWDWHSSCVKNKLTNQQGWHSKVIQIHLRVSKNQNWRRALQVDQTTLK